MLHWGVDDFAIGEIVHVRIVTGYGTEVLYEGLATVKDARSADRYTELSIEQLCQQRESRCCVSYEDRVRKATKLDKYLAGIYD